MGVAIGGRTCDLCGMPFPAEEIAPVYLPQIDETIEACEGCQQQDSRP